jgi:hypothetical protein
MLAKVLGKGQLAREVLRKLTTVERVEPLANERRGGGKRMLEQSVWFCIHSSIISYYYYSIINIVNDYIDCKCIVLYCFIVGVDCQY